jgi:hypothetical protein
LTKGICYHVWRREIKKKRFPLPRSADERGGGPFEVLVVWIG